METETVLLATTLFFAVSTIIAPVVAIAKGKKALKEKQKVVDRLEHDLVRAVNDMLQLETRADRRISSLNNEVEKLRSKVLLLTPKQGKDGKFVSKSKS